jgi:hypothetical protein
MSRRQAWAHLSLLAAIACASNTADVTITPSDWSSSASREPPCSTSDYRGDTRQHALPDSLGWIALPGSLTLQPAEQSNILVFIGGDSTRVEVWVTPEPSAALMTIAHLKLQTEPQCRITIGGRFALVSPFAVSDSGQRPVRHAAIVNTLLSRGLALNFLLYSPSDSGRSVLLGTVAHLQLHEFPMR